MIKKFLKRIYRALLFLGFNPIVLVQNIKGLGFYFRDYKKLKKQKKGDKSFPFGNNYAILNERFEEAGSTSKQYFYQDLYVAQHIFKSNPIKHVDIGSSIGGFVSHVASFRELEVFDIRKYRSERNIIFKQADLMRLPVGLENYCDSISSLHVIEHFGLGRYGDPIDYYGHKKAIDNIATILKKGGIFYFSVPIGKQRIEFNAQRVFSVSYLIDLLKENFSILSFSYIDDNDNFHEDVEIEDGLVKSNFNCNNGCGVFVLLKK